MKIDWQKWQQIERRQNQLEADVAFCKEKLDNATKILRDCDISLTRSVQNRGLFRRHDVAEFIRAARNNPDAVLASYQDQPITPILQQYSAAHRERQRAADAHQQAESAFIAHGASYHTMRHWVAEQQSKGLLA